MLGGVGAGGKTPGYPIYVTLFPFLKKIDGRYCDDDLPSFLDEWGKVYA